MEAYPITLHIKSKKAVVIGGGSVAFRKIKRLLSSGACVTVISPDVCTSVYELYTAGRLSWQRKIFEQEDLEEALIVMAASGDKDVNAAVAAAAKPHQLVNIVDDPHAGNFHVPASFTRGKLTISIATDGASPILARKLRDELDQQFEQDFAIYMDFLDEVRHKVIHRLEMDKKLKKDILEYAASRECRQSIEKQQSLLFHLHLLTFTESSPRTNLKEMDINISDLVNL